MLVLVIVERALGVDEHGASPVGELLGCTEADDQVAWWLRPAKAALAVKGDDFTHYAATL
jgi:hypothetical protein